MKKTVYDFSEAIKEANVWYKPSELSTKLKNAVLNLAYIEDDGSGTYPGMIHWAQTAALTVCDFLDKIKEIEVEQ